MAASDDAGGNATRLRTELDQLANAGVNVVRIMAAVEGAPSRQPNRIYPVMQRSPGVWDERLFDGLDRCIAECGRRGIRAIMTMGNTWQWSGGIAQLHAWSKSVQDIVYPSAWDFSLPPQRHDGHPGWGNFTNADYAPYMAYQEKFYSDEKAQQWYIDHLDRLMSRVNSITGRTYSEVSTGARGSPWPAGCCIAINYLTRLLRLAEGRYYIWWVKAEHVATADSRNT